MSADLGEHTGPGIRQNPVHGTYCAAVVAGAANNSLCGVGVAYNARVGGIRLLAKRRVLDVHEAKALNYRLDRVHIYSASWGEFLSKHIPISVKRKLNYLKVPPMMADTSEALNALLSKLCNEE